jgi:CheY-like chemotaxis protein
MQNPKVETDTAAPLKMPDLNAPKLKLHITFPGAKGPLENVYREVLGRMEYDVLPSESEAQVVITNRVTQCQNSLRSGKHVLHLTSEKDFSLFDAASSNLQQHPEYKGRYHNIDQLQGILHVLEILSKIESELSSGEAHLPKGNLDLSKVMLQSQISGKKILVLDNSAHNRAAASYQFGVTNAVTVFESYIEAVNALKRGSFDLALVDLLMPPENYLLGAQAFARVVGSEFPAGIFVALQAAKREIEEICIVSDSNHHDHPATAILESILATPLQCESGSKISFCPAHTVRCEGLPAPVKDWDKSIARHIRRS